MVAYSFAPMFADEVAALTKRQTVRGPRQRHARPGEPVQLYTGMRTRSCRKLVEIDPIVIDVRPITIDFDSGGGIVEITIDGVSLDQGGQAAFALADGFGPLLATATRRMGDFWHRHHGTGRFDGIVIRWEPAVR